jgi:L-alanine-DL-glutamate epimerase-like enolase superfamily enzyme
MKLEAITLRAVRLPLVRPYVLSYRTFTEFEPIIVEARDGDGRIGWGKGHIARFEQRDTRGRLGLLPRACRRRGRNG